MDIEEFEKRDVGFQTELFLSRANSMIKKIYNAISLDEMDRVRHFMDHDLYQRIQNEIQLMDQKGLRYTYKEVNVSSQILRVFEEEVTYNVEVSASCRYQKSFNDREERVSVLKKVMFQKKKNAVLEESPRCMGCGTSFNIYEMSSCPSCGRLYDLEEYDYIIKDMDLL